MKKTVIVSGLVILVVVTAYFLTKSDFDYSEEEYVIPEAVSLNLYTNFDDDSKPALALSIYGGNGCDKVSALNISRSQKEGTMFVTIEGYSIQEYLGMASCSAVVAEPRAEIDVLEFLKNGGHQIWFKIGDEESRYSLSQDEYAVYLEPIEVSNVISHEMGVGQPSEPQSIALITNKEKFAVLSLSGTYRPNIIYTDYLRNVARENKLVPADEVLKGFRQGDDSLWVLVGDLQASDTAPAIIGEITYDSGEWGIESVGVEITRKQPPYQYSF